MELTYPDVFTSPGPEADIPKAAIGTTSRSLSRPKQRDDHFVDLATAPSKLIQVGHKPMSVKAAWLDETSVPFHRASGNIPVAQVSSKPAGRTKSDALRRCNGTAHAIDLMQKDHIRRKGDCPQRAENTF